MNKQTSSLLTPYYSNNEAIRQIHQNYIITIIIFWSRSNENLEEHEIFDKAAFFSVFLNWLAHSHPVEWKIKSSQNIFWIILKITYNDNRETNTNLVLHPIYIELQTEMYKRKPKTPQVAGITLLQCKRNSQQYLGDKVYKLRGFYFLRIEENLVQN